MAPSGVRLRNHRSRAVRLQRIIDASAPLRGYDVRDLEALAAQGIPALMNTRTYPRTFSWEQVHESKPWYTKTGRLEFYRPEPELIAAGENLVVYREPVDSTFYDPNVIVARLKPPPEPLPKRDVNTRADIEAADVPATVEGNPTLPGANANP